MITFDKFVLSDKIPIYLQIIMYVKRGIVAENIRNNDEMPSRRVLSALLGVNPNTIQKAYKQLEDEGLIMSHSGAKSCVCIDDMKLSNLKQDLLKEDAQNVISALKQMGMTKSEAIDLIEKYWE